MSQRRNKESRTSGGTVTEVAVNKYARIRFSLTDQNRQVQSRAETINGTMQLYGG